jgi:cell pole-organizing protein PopZ
MLRFYQTTLRSPANLGYATTPGMGNYITMPRSPANLGCGCAGRRRRGTLKGLGDSILCPGPVKSQLDDLSAKIAAAQNDLSAMAQQVRAANNAGADVMEEGAMVAAQQRDLNTMISSLTYAYRTFCGTVPPGLSGLGVIPAIPLATAAVTIAAIAAALAAWWIYEQSLKDRVNQALANAKGQAQNNIAYAEQQLSQAVVSGDTAAQQAWQKVIDDSAAASTSIPPAGVGDFLSKNWPYLAAAGAGLIFLPRLFN